MNQYINEKTIEIHDEADKLFKQVKRIELSLINVEIATAKLSDHPEGRALFAIAEHINDKFS